MENTESLELIKRIKSISETGLVYCSNEYDKERFDELVEISIELLSVISNTPIKKLNDFFMPIVDYPTPKVDIRAFLLNKENKVLLVKEKLDGRWSLPGGWADVGLSPTEVVIKEIKEETGLNASVKKILAVYDKKCHPHPPQPFYVYKMVFWCETTDENIKTSFDIEEAKYFGIDELPEISEDRILKTQILQLHEMIVNKNSTVYVD